MERCTQGCDGENRAEDHLENPGVNKRIILKWILDKRGGARTGSIWLRTGGGLL